MKTVIGIDEVGRGCWAGPLLVVAARLNADLPLGVKDSKLLSRKKRQELFEPIKLTCDIGEGWVQPKEIDDLGLTESMRLGAERALKNLGAKYEETIIFDGAINYCSSKYLNVSVVVDADALFPIVSAASIVAKVLRDNYMANLHPRYAAFEFDKHVGYGTARHSELLKTLGISDLHRLSFKPIKAYL